MKILRNTIVLLSILLLTNFSFLSAQHSKAASMPFDMIIIGYDSDLGGTNSEKIGLLTMVDIDEGYTFGLINMIRNSGNWETANGDDFVQISFKIKSGFLFKKGSLLEIKNLNGQISIISNDIDVSSQFEINGLKDSTSRFIQPTGSYLSLYSGYFMTNQKEVSMFKSMPEMVSYSLS